MDYFAAEMSALRRKGAVVGPTSSTIVPDPTGLPTIIYVAAKANSGSTLLELLLSSHRELVGVGEIKRLARSPHGNRYHTKGTCTCGVPILRCPFWTAVFDHVRQNGGPTPLEMDVFTDNAATFADHNQRLYRAIAAVSGKRFVVDSSKDHRRLSHLLAAGIFDVRPIVLRRGSHGVVYSNVRRGGPWLRAALNQTIWTVRCSLATEGTNALRVRYERLATNPQETVASIMAWLGLGFEPGQLDWTSHEHHQLAGNAMRFRRDSRIVLDRAWEEGLSRFQKVAIAAIEAPLVLPDRWWKPMLRVYEAGKRRAGRVGGAK
jgi:Sulfotransferase family